MTIGKPIKGQPWPNEPWSARVEGGKTVIFDAKGNDITNSDAARERMLACVNGMAGVWLAETHVQETADRLRRLEEARRAAVEQFGVIGPGPKHRKAMLELLDRIKADQGGAV